MDYGTAYVGDWKFFDLVEDAEYKSPRDIPPERNELVKVKLDDSVLEVFGQGSPLSAGGSFNGAIAWTPTDATLELLIDGVLTLATSGAYIIRAATKSRFGHWQLTVEPKR